MRSVLVTGSNRGLGLEFVRQLAEQSRPPEQVVFASCRNPHGATHLQKLAASNPSIKIVKLDVLSEETYHSALESVERIVGESGLNVLINNAGVNRGATMKYGTLTRREVMDTFDVNTIAPMRITQMFLPLIKRAAGTSSVQTMSFERAAVCNISSSLGSISRNSSGGFAVFRESKAALNMFSKSISIDLRRDKILVMCLCPGWVRTDTGGPFAVQSTAEAVEKLLANMKEATEEYHGKLIANTSPATFLEV